MGDERLENIQFEVSRSAAEVDGDIVTEDLAFMLNSMGYDTGLDLDALLEVTEWLAQQLGHPVPALLGRARPFPQVAQQV